MDLAELGKVVAKFAPTLGALLPVPGGTIIGKAIAAAFGGDIEDPEELATKIERDPQAAIKLAEIQANLQIGMRQADVEDYKTEVDDRKSARERVIELAKAGIRDYMTEILAFIIISGYYILNYCFASSPQTEAKEILQNSRDIAMLVAAFYFGSSRGERKASMER